MSKVAFTGNNSYVSHINSGSKKASGRKARLKMTQATCDAIRGAAAAIGSDGVGEGGLVGYLEWLAVNRPRAFLRLLGQALVFEEKQRMAVANPHQR